MKKQQLVRGASYGALVLSLAGCGKIKAMIQGGDAGAGAGAASASGLSLAGFEGEIQIAATAKRPGQPVKTYTVPLFVKTNKFRVDKPAGLEGAEAFGGFYGIVDTDAKKLWGVLDKPKQVVEIDLNTIGEQAKALKPSVPRAGGSAAKAPEYPPKITKTGKTDTVAGFSCELWELESTEPGDKSKANVCVSKQGVSWFRIPLTGAPAQIAALAELLDGQHFPMRAVVYEKDGATEAMRIEVTKVDKRTLDAKMFTPPADYKIVDVGQAMAGLAMGGMGGLGVGGTMPPGKRLPLVLPAPKAAARR